MASSTRPKLKKDGEYLTKEALNRAVRKGVKEAAAEAIETADSIVVAEGQWVVRRHKDGRVERIRKLDRTSTDEIKRKIRKLAAQ